MIISESRNHHWESRSSLSTTETCSIRSYSVTIQLKLRRNCLTDSLDLENPLQRSEKILPLLGILPTVLRSDISSPICSVVQLLLLPKHEFEFPNWKVTSHFVKIFPIHDDFKRADFKHRFYTAIWCFVLLHVPNNLNKNKILFEDLSIIDVKSKY